MEQSRCEPDRIHLNLTQHLSDVFRRYWPRWHDHQNSPVEQRAPDLKGGGIKAHGSGLQQSRSLAQLHVIGPDHEPLYGSMRNLDSFGFSGRAGSIDDIGRISGLETGLRVMAGLRGNG